MKQSFISKLLWWCKSTDRKAEEIANDIYEGFHGIPHTEKERKKMTPAKLAVLLSQCDKGSPAYILFEHELHRKIAKIQARPGYIGVWATIGGILLGWLLAQWHPLAQKNSLDIIADHIKKHDEITTYNRGGQDAAKSKVIPLPENFSINPKSNTEHKQRIDQKSNKENAHP
ncbi:MAG: hypothetical protein M0Z67_12915 [Nitrospiraceae bacterium]|nr:hypothetical protein [Nitrospiraceae bacterium]